MLEWQSQGQGLASAPAHAGRLAMELEKQLLRTVQKPIETF